MTPLQTQPPIREPQPATADSILRFWRRRRAGKIAHLPQAVRDKINVMLSDGLTYAEIIAKLGEAGRGLNKDNLSRWRKAQHQDWLWEQHWLEATDNRPEFAAQTIEHQ